MKKLSSESAFTLIELLAVIAVIAILAAMLLPATTDRGPRGGKGIQCLSQIHQIQIGLIMFEDDHHGEFPFQIPITNGGTLEFIYGPQVFPHFQKLSAYLKQPQIFCCPLDTERTSVTNYEALNNQAISYFLNADASTNAGKFSQMILIGDRFLQANGQPVKTGLFTVTTSLDMSWTPNMHKGLYNLGFVDGHAERTRAANLNAYVRNQPTATNRFCIP